MNTSLAAIPLLLCMTACGGEPPRPRVEIVTPDRTQFTSCLGLLIVPPDNLPPYEAFTLPDGRQVVPLDRVRTRDGIQATFLVKVDNARRVCRAAVTYADQWAARLASAGQADPQK